jgi:hypothetical protein
MFHHTKKGSRNLVQDGIRPKVHQDVPFESFATGFHLLDIVDVPSVSQPFKLVAHMVSKNFKIQLN